METTPKQANAGAASGGRFPGSGRPQFGQGSASALSMKWSALHDAAATVALIASIKDPGMTPPIRNLPTAIRDARAERRALAEQGIDDLSAMMEPGLTALLSAHARGADPRPAARALWAEFVAARDAIVALAPERGERGPMRFA